MNDKEMSIEEQIKAFETAANAAAPAVPKESVLGKTIFKRRSETIEN